MLFQSSCVLAAIGNAVGSASLVDSRDTCLFKSEISDSVSARYFSNSNRRLANSIRSWLQSLVSRTDCSLEEMKSDKSDSFCF